MKKILHSILFFILLAAGLHRCASVKNLPERIVGVTLVAPPEVSATNPLIPAQKMGFGWVALVPYGFLSGKTGQVEYEAVEKNMFWGESIAGIRHSVRWAREQGQKVMLKPQVWAGRTWIGAVNFQNETEWAAFEKSYELYILLMAQIAESEGVEILCIGTELSPAVLKRGVFWKQLIEKTRRLYRGKLTYSANWNDWQGVPFWADLDHIGLNSYFPLEETSAPHPDSLRAAWQPIAAQLEAKATALKKSVLFTEMGYLAVPGCCGKLWELEPKRDSLPVDTACQARAFEVLLDVFSKKTWWAGGFVWKYYPATVMSPEHGLKDYDIQGKPAGAVFERWFRAPE